MAIFRQLQYGRTLCGEVLFARMLCGQVRLFFQRPGGASQNKLCLEDDLLSSPIRIGNLLQEQIHGGLAELVGEALADAETNLLEHIYGGITEFCADVALPDDVLLLSVSRTA